jgi:nucleoporin NUP82
MYDYQRKYVTALVKQLPAGTIFPSASRSVTIHPPTTIKTPPLRQGPFLLQPSPRALEASEGGDATDITYLSFGTEGDDSEDPVRDTEHLGVVLVSFQDGKVDLFLDVEKVEARWDTKVRFCYLTVDGY